MADQKTKASFVVYIDESGDEGFVFKEDGSGSSRWLVLSAAVIRKANDLQMVSCLKEVREALGKPPKTPLHFVDLKHEQRVPLLYPPGRRPAHPYREGLLSVWRPDSPGLPVTPLASYAASAAPG